MSSADRRIVVVTIIAIVLVTTLIVAGLLSRVASGTWQTFCWVDFSVPERSAADDFARAMEDGGYDPAISGPSGSVSAVPERVTVEVADGGLFGDGAGIETDVADALRDHPKGHLEGGSCLGKPLFS